MPRYDEDRFQAIDGSVSAPAYTWLNDLDTGFYRPAPNVIAAVAGGSESFRMYPGYILFGTEATNEFNKRIGRHDNTFLFLKDGDGTWNAGLLLSELRIRPPGIDGATGAGQLQSDERYSCDISVSAMGGGGALTEVLRFVGSTGVGVDPYIKLVKALRLNNNEFFISRNALDNGNVNIVRVNPNNQIEFGTNILVPSEIYIIERAAAETDYPGYGQLWVRNDVANTLWFTDDAGVDHQLAFVP